MAKATRTAVMTAATLLTAPVAGAADHPVHSAIVVHVEHFAGLPPDVVERAQEQASAIFASAGVHITWAPGRRPAAPQSGMHVSLLLLSYEMGEKKIGTDAVPRGVLGQASGLAARAYIFTHRVTGLARRHRRDPGPLLGQVIAHEMGHLLLPTFSHSNTGVMRSTFDPGDKAGRFTDEQGAVIRLAAATAGR